MHSILATSRAQHTAALTIVAKTRHVFAEAPATKVHLVTARDLLAVKAAGTGIAFAFLTDWTFLEAFGTESPAAISAFSVAEGTNLAIT